MAQLKLADEVKYRLAGSLGKALINTIAFFCDGELENRDAAARARSAGHPVIYAVWHGQITIPAWTHKNRGIGILVSQSRDGEYVARVVSKLGFHIIRGSSTRGAEEGFGLLVEALQSGRDIAITPDGPKGPRHEVKKGLVYLARAANAAIIPVGIGLDRYKEFASSWDKFRVMLPTAYVLARYGEPIYVPERSNKFQMEDIRLQVQESLNALTVDCDSRVADARRTKRSRVRYKGE